MVTPSQSSGSPVRTTGEKQAASLVELTRAAAYTEPQDEQYHCAFHGVPPSAQPSESSKLNME